MDEQPSDIGIKLIRKAAVRGPKEKIPTGEVRVETDETAWLKTKVEWRDAEDWGG